MVKPAVCGANGVHIVALRRREIAREALLRPKVDRAAVQSHFRVEPSGANISKRQEQPASEGGFAFFLDCLLNPLPA